MKKLLGFSFRCLITAGFCWGTGAILFEVNSNSAIASMLLLLEVLAVATTGDWLLAILTSLAASMAFSWYFIDAAENFQITSLPGAITFCSMLVTALTGSGLSIRAERRAAEAIRRREEMERLQRLGNVLLASVSVADSAENIVSHVVGLFDVCGAVLRLEGFERPFQAGRQPVGPVSAIEIHAGSARNVLHLYGPQPSFEVQNALANLVDLVLDRARIVEERARTEASRRGEELRNTVLNALAHNFKTPLTSIKAAASMLRGSDGLLKEADHELAVVIDEEADRLELLIRESLNLARIEAHQENPHIEVCSIVDLAGGVRSRVSRYLGEREFAIDVADDLPRVSGDRFLFEQMLMQVVDNAWKYSRQDSRIRLSAAFAGSRVVVTVQNEGSQIPPEEQAKIFAKFYRGSEHRSQVEGTGLGLPIALAIAKAHGGTMWLDSEPEGPAFRFSLPAVMDRGLD